MQFDDLDSCPYNSEHRIAKVDLSKHIKRCKDKPDPKKAHPAVQVSQPSVEESKTPAEVKSPFMATSIRIHSDVLKTIAPPPGFVSTSPKKTNTKAEEETFQPIDIERPTPVEPAVPAETSLPVQAPQAPKTERQPTAKQEEWVTAHSRKIKTKSKSAAVEDAAQTKAAYSTLAEMQLAPELNKRRKAIRKKLKDIRSLEERKGRGEKLDAQQNSKLTSKRALEQELKQLSSS